MQSNPNIKKAYPCDRNHSYIIKLHSINPSQGEQREISRLHINGQKFSRITSNLPKPTN